MSWFSGMQPTPPVGISAVAPPATWSTSGQRLQNFGIIAPGTVLGSSSAVGHSLATAAVQSMIASGLQPPVVPDGFTALARGAGVSAFGPPAPDRTKLWIELGLAGAAALGLVVLLRRRAAT